MRFFERLWNILRGKKNVALEKLEDPEQQISQVVSELTEAMRRLQQSVATAITDEKRLKIQLDEAMRTSEEWEQRATLALEQGDEKLAEEALVRQRNILTKAAQIKQSWETQKQATDALKQSLADAKQKVEEAKRQYNLLLARYRTAETKQQLVKPSNKSQVDFIESLNEKILRIETETEANLEMMESSDSSQLESDFKALEDQKFAAESLEALKGKIAAHQGSTISLERTKRKVS